MIATAAILVPACLAALVRGWPMWLALGLLAFGVGVWLIFDPDADE